MKTTRRDFLKTTTVAAAGFMAAAGNAQKMARANALESVAVASIGVGGKGSGDLANAALYGKIVALCDVDMSTLDGAKSNHPDAQTFYDFRELFDQMGDKVDACTISTPDHMHTAATAMAIKLGKHCYTQKPLTRTIGEARYLGNLAKKYGVCTQMGNQGSSLDSLRSAIAQVRAGVLGDIKEVFIWTNRPIWAQGPNRDMTMEKFEAQVRAENPDDDEIVADELAEKKKQIEEALKVLKWDLWLGTAPKRDFWPGIYHSFEWRGWWDFGSGSLGDMACHTANIPFGACELKNPTRVVAESSGHDFNSFPAVSKIWFDFPATDWRSAIKVTWLDSKITPDPAVLDRYKIESPSSSGALIVGEKGALYSPNDYGQAYELIAEGGAPMEELPNVEYRKAPEDEYSGNFDSRNSLEWFTAIHAGDPNICFSNFPYYGGPLTETILLGNLAVWAASEAGKRGESIEWDAQNLQVKNLDSLKTPGVAKLVRPVYADGYEQIDV